MPEPLTPESAIRALERDGRVVVRAAVRGIGFAIVGALVFTAIGTAMLSGALRSMSLASLPAMLVGGLAVAFFGIIGIPSLIWRWKTADRALTITPHGADLAGGSSVQWGLVRSARLATVIGQRFVVLVPERGREREALALLNPIDRAVARINGMLLREPCVVAIPAQLELPPGQLLTVVQRARRLGGHLRP